MTQKYYVIILAVIGIFVGLWLFFARPLPSKKNIPVIPTSLPTQSIEPELIMNQEEASTSATVSFVTLPVPGFIVIRDTTPNHTILGVSSMLPIGKSSFITIMLDQPLLAHSSYRVEAYADDGNELYTLEDLDNPIRTSNGEILLREFSIEE